MSGRRTLRQAIEELAATASGGFQLSQLAGDFPGCRGSGRSVALDMVAKGLLIRVQRSPRNVRFFGAKFAEAAGAAPAQPPTPKRARASWNPRDTSIQPVITSRTKVTIAPPAPQPWRTNTYGEN